MQRWQVWNDNTTVSTGKQQLHYSSNMIPQTYMHKQVMQQIPMSPHVTDSNYIFGTPTGIGDSVRSLIRRKYHDLHLSTSTFLSLLSPRHSSQPCYICARVQFFSYIVDNNTVYFVHIRRPLQ